MLDEDYMKLALRLANKGLGKTSPNPMVGAVIVKDNRIIGQGYHHHFGGKHAEINAIESTTEDISGATMYVTLEPCCHYGKTPPCVEAIIKNDIGKVVIGILDPYPSMSGRSMEILRQHGIETKVGVLEEECRSLNEAYLKHIITGVPLVTVKFAQTLDGRIATSTGNSQWISSPASQRMAHKLRTTHDAVMVGAGTVLSDNPQLTVRLVKGRNPTRIILDSRLRIPLKAKVFTIALLWIVIGCSAAFAVESFAGILSNSFIFHFLLLISVFFPANPLHHLLKAVLFFHKPVLLEHWHRSSGDAWKWLLFPASIPHSSDNP